MYCAGGRGNFVADRIHAVAKLVFWPETQNKFPPKTIMLLSQSLAGYFSDCVVTVAAILFSLQKPQTTKS